MLRRRRVRVSKLVFRLQTSLILFGEILGRVFLIYWGHFKFHIAFASQNQKNAIPKFLQMPFELHIGRQTSV